MIQIDLTKKQKKALKPLFQKVYELNAQSAVCTIAAQVYEDGIVADVVTYDCLHKKMLVSELPMFSSAAEKMESLK